MTTQELDNLPTAFIKEWSNSRGRRKFQYYGYLEEWQVALLSKYWHIKYEKLDTLTDRIEVYEFTDKYV